MHSSNPSTGRTRLQPLLSKCKAYYVLTKPEVNLLILMTTSAGYYLGSGSPVRWANFVRTIVGTLLVASGTATLNQLTERGYDSEMRRTAGRPLPSRKISPPEALIFGLLLSVLGGLYLFVAVNHLTAWLAISALVSYLLIYTPLKRKTALCTLLGAFPGATPALIGWAGASGSLSAGAWFLFAILFLWQFPHFLAIALMYREDYQRAGFHMLPEFDQAARFTRFEIVVFTLALIVTTLLPLAGHTHGILYALAMSVAGSFFLRYSLRLMTSNSPLSASRLLHASVAYLPVVLVVLMIFKP